LQINKSKAFQGKELGDELRDPTIAIHRKALLDNLQFPIYKNILFTSNQGTASIIVYKNQGYI